MSRIAIGLLLLASVLQVAHGQSLSFDLAPDVPTDLAASTFLPWEVVRFDAVSGTHSSTLVLPGDPPVDALHRLEGGDWLLSVDAPTDLGGTTYGPAEVVRYDGATFSLFLDGTAAGIPAGANLDSLFVEGGDLVLGFDVPTTLGAVTYGPSDLVRYTGAGFVSFFDAGAAGVPPGSNASGATLRDGEVVLSFDVPTDLGGTTFLPGELVRWNGASFVSLYSDPGWPAGSIIFGVTLPPAPGAIPPTLTASRISPTQVMLSWETSCSAGASDYAIYEGQLGSWYSHTQVDCSDDAGDLTEVVTPVAGDRYFLLVPHNAPNDEGSYGTDSAGNPRPSGAATCVPTRATASCG